MLPSHVRGCCSHAALRAAVADDGMARCLDCPLGYFAVRRHHDCAPPAGGYYADVAQAPVALCAESGHTPVTSSVRCLRCFPGLREPQRVQPAGPVPPDTRVPGPGWVGAPSVKRARIRSPARSALRHRALKSHGCRFGRHVCEGSTGACGVCEPCSVRVLCPRVRGAGHQPGFWRAVEGERARRVCSACQPVRAGPIAGESERRQVVHRSTAGLWRGVFQGLTG